jgi:hypothetical protein
MLKLLPFILLFSCVTTGGKTSTCTIATNASTELSKKMADALACKAPEKIQADMQAWLEKEGICEKQTQASVREWLCKPAASWASSLLVNSLLPSTWQCSGGLAKEALETVVLNLCVSGTFIQDVQPSATPAPAPAAASSKLDCPASVTQGQKFEVKAKGSPFAKDQAVYADKKGKLTKLYASTKTCKDCYVTKVALDKVGKRTVDVQLADGKWVSADVTVTKK